VTSLSGFVILRTAGFANLNPDVQAEIMRIALSKIYPKTDWVIFDPEADEEQLEDEGRTLRVPFGKIKEKVYAILDDYGSAEALSEQLGQKVKTRYTLTFLLASEY